MNYRWYAGIAIALIVMLAGLTLAYADDESCMRIPCQGKCISKEEAKGKVMPMYCLQKSSCYEGVECTILEDGKCGWKETDALKACLASRSGGMLVRPMGSVHTQPMQPAQPAPEQPGQ